MAMKISAWIAAVLVLVLYSSMAIFAVGNVLGMQELSEILQLPISGVGWWWLSFGVALPILGIAVSLLIARRSTAWVRVLVLAAGLCVCAAIQLEVSHLVPESIFFVA